VPICTPREASVYNLFYDKMQQEIAGITDERAEAEREAIEIALKPNLNRIIADYSPRKIESVYSVSADDFKSLNTWALSFMQDIANSGASVIGRDAFKGKIIKLIVEDENILKATDALKMKYNGIADRTLKELLISETRGYSGIEMWDRVAELIEENTTDE